MGIDPIERGFAVTAVLSAAVFIVSLGYFLLGR